MIPENSHFERWKPEEAFSDDTKELWQRLHANDPDFNPDEFNFNQSRFEKKAEKHANRGLIHRAFAKIRYINEARRESPLNKPGADLLAVDFAHEEALIENQERDLKKKSKEYEKWREMLTEVVTDLKLKRDHPESAEAKKIKVLKIIMGGGNRAAYSAGQEVAQHEMGFYPETIHLEQQPDGKSDESKPKTSPVFDRILGISAGIATAAFTIGGKEQVLDGTSYYYQECTRPEFISFKPGRWNQILNLNWVMERFVKGDEKGEKKLNVQGIIDSPVKLYAQVADKTDGTPHIVNAKTAKEGVLQAMKGCMTIPWLYGETVIVNGIERIDGGIEPLPIEQILKEFPDVTDIIIEPNIPFDELNVFKLDVKDQLIVGFTKLVGIFSKNASSVLANKIWTQKTELRKAFNFITEHTGV